MSIKEFILNKWSVISPVSTQKNLKEKEEKEEKEEKKEKEGAKDTLQNPYVAGAEGRRQWNDRYMNMAKSIRNWQMAFASMAVVTIILAIVVAKIAGESKIKPYVVETNRGVPYTLKAVEDISPTDKRIINYAVNQFIINGKSIIADTAAEKSMLHKVYAYSAGNTMNFLQEYYAKNNPFNLAGDYTINVNIINSMPISHDTWQVTWDETKKSTVGGKVLEITRWMANVTYQFSEVNPKTMEDNPFGIYITNVSWSQSAEYGR